MTGVCGVWGDIGWLWFFFEIGRIRGCNRLCDVNFDWEQTLLGLVLLCNTNRAFQLSNTRGIYLDEGHARKGLQLVAIRRCGLPVGCCPRKPLGFKTMIIHAATHLFVPLQPREPQSPWMRQSSDIPAGRLSCT